MTTSREALLSSVSVEWYTPIKYIEAARSAMGSIDLDPASCAAANEVVRAANYYDAASNGLDKRWHGNVFCNPPYGRGGQSTWSKKMIEEYKAGHITQGIMLLNAATDTNWFTPLWSYTICFVKNRIKFTSGEGVSKHSPTHGSVFVYFGPEEGRRDFISEFKLFGPVVTGVAI